MRLENFTLRCWEGVRILPTKSSRFERLNQFAGAPVCDRLLTLANPKAGYKPALRFMKRNGFTLIELLVVIAIIGILAALITNLAGPAAAKRKINRVTVELAQLETAIDSYKEKKGFYPPSHANTNNTVIYNAVTNQLFYELSGTINQDTKYETINGSETISVALIRSMFQTRGFANSSVDPAEVKNFMIGFKPTQIGELNSGVNVLIVPVPGPDDIKVGEKKINTWRYNSLSPTHNPDFYDLWAEIVIGGKTNIIGNWKE